MALVGFPCFAPRLALAVVLTLGFLAEAHAQVVINEVLASNRVTSFDEDGDASDWVELVNVGMVAVDLGGFSLTDDPADPDPWLFPAVSLAPGGRMLVWCSGKDRTEVDPERITEPGSPLLFLPSLVSLEAGWRYLAGLPGAGAPPAEWTAPDFDDAAWPSGQPAFGFGSGDDPFGTPVEEGSSALFLRHAFDYEPGGANLILQVSYDDGFIAYLNGVRVAEDNPPEEEPLTFASEASGSNSANRADRFDLGEWRDALVPGRNVLAIALFNRRASSNDMVLSAELGTVPPTFHADFQIDRAGESLYLYNASGELADEVTLPEQSPDQSYGRSPDGDGAFRYHLMVTPAAVNDGPVSDQPLVVGDTTFSQDRGFYDAPFDVEITTETPAAAIRYTVDGSEPSEENGALYEGPIRIETTTTLRARALHEGLRPTNVDTHTYIFLDHVIEQSAADAMAAGFPRTWGGTLGDYDMDPDVVGPNDRFNGEYAATIRDDLLSLPTMSIAVEIEEFFGARGLYSQSTQGGIAWERPASVEFFTPEGDREFQQSCGLRIQGGYFRQNSATRKHSLRLLFKGIYGPTKLEFPLFGDGAADSFDTLTLRAGANDGYSWDAARNTEQYTRDEFGRSLQRATGNAGAHGTFVHLYINGLYWGLYNPVERPDHSFSASYYGGDKEDWDSVHDEAATNGDLEAWRNMLVAAQAGGRSLETFQELQGRNVDGSPNPAVAPLLDVENYIDYLIVNLWGGNWDWPWKNWWAGRDRTEASTGFKFYCWDYENTIGNNRGRSPLTMNALQNNFSSAGQAHQRLMPSPEYRLLFADRAQRFLTGDGVLTPGSLVPRYEGLAATVERAIVAESARWGDQHHNPPLGLREWERERDWILEEYLPERTGVVLDQFRAQGLYPRIDAPSFDHDGGLVDAGLELLPRVAEGIVYYTTDGSDPRLPGGEISPAARTLGAGERLSLLAENAAARVHVPSDGSLGLAWTQLDFDDALWRDGPLPVGYDTRDDYDELIGTDVTESAYELNASVYIRVPFEVAEPAALRFLTLRIQYDDAFVAYVNGERVAARNAPENPDWESGAAGPRGDSDSLTFETVDLGDPRAVLRPGRNVLAIHGMNRRSSDSDFLITPELLATAADQISPLRIDESTLVRARVWLDGEWSALSEETFVVDSGIPLRITEIMYHPAASSLDGRFDADEFEFIEIRNVGAQPIDLVDIRLGGGVQFDFAESLVEVLAPGASLVVVENVTAFAERYGMAGILVAGQYTGKLGNAGDSLTLEGRLGEPILDFVYSDEWHPITDGGGSSLTVVDAFAARESWGDAASWVPSPSPGGTPGVDASGEPSERGGWQRPGDSSQDGAVNLTDAVLILRTLFVDGAASLPCDGGSIAVGGNRTLNDVDQSGAVDVNDPVLLLSYLFLRGAPPALGVECVRIPGCPDACGG